jgi:3-hydroxyacyl-CoA dehydrogenase
MLESHTSALTPRLEVRSPTELDRPRFVELSWMITLQTGLGPFGMMDRMGLGVVHHIATLLGAHDSARYLDDEFIRQGHLGVASGKGFYSYPHPAFAQLDFTRRGPGPRSPTQVPPLTGGRA